MKKIFLTLMMIPALASCSGSAWNIVDSFNNNLIVENRYQMILDGLQVSLLITFCAAVLGTMLTVAASIDHLTQLSVSQLQLMTR